MPPKSWNEYYKATKENPPREILLSAISYLHNKNTAIDIGAGSLNDSRYLLEQGFDVTAIDKSPLITEEAQSINNEKFHAFNTSCEKYNFPENSFDLASAMFSLPFVEPESFDYVFDKIKKSLNPSGVFCGQFFGDKDEWSSDRNMTFHTKYQIEELLKDFEIISIDEKEEDSLTAARSMKHWHIFEVIARKL
jgi:tellurite methyltransferase